MLDGIAAEEIQHSETKKGIEGRVRLLRRPWHASTVRLNNLFYWLQRQHNGLSEFLSANDITPHRPPWKKKSFVSFWHCLFKGNLFSSSFEIKINRFILTPSLHRAAEGKRSNSFYAERGKQIKAIDILRMREAQRGLFRLFDFPFVMIRIFLTTSTLRRAIHGPVFAVFN